MKLPDPATKPLKIQRLPEISALRIEWADGYVCEMGYEHLRRLCPCASCAHERGQAETGLRVVGEEAPSGPLQLNGVRLVGTYAVTLAWSDGHDTGIYSFRFLREICPHEGSGSEAARLDIFQDS